MTPELHAYTDPVLAFVNGPLAKAALVLGLCLVLVAVAQWMLRKAARRWGSRPLPGAGLKRGDRVAIVLIVGLATLFVLVAFAMSAAALHDSATWLEETPVPINGGDLRFLFPLVLDGLIVLFLSLDLWTEWRGMRHPFYRWVAYGLSTLTLYLNITHGDGGALLGHAAPPLGVIVISEGLAIWIRSMAHMIDTGKSTDRVPMGHWIARPASAWRVWRLMLGWHITSYEQAVEMERRRSMAYAMLREQYGPAWRTETPRHLRWMLDNGSELSVAYDIIRAMTRDRVAMTPDEVALVALSRATPSAVEAAAAEEARDTTGDTATGRRSLFQRMTVVAGHGRITAGRDTPALERGDTTRQDTGQGDTSQATPGVAPDTDTALATGAADSDATATGDEDTAAPDTDTATPVVSMADMADRDRQVVAWLIEDPDMSGAEIGRRVGATAKTGQRLRKRLAPVAAAHRDTGQVAGDSDTDTPDEVQLPPGVRIKRWKSS